MHIILGLKLQCIYVYIGLYVLYVCMYIYYINTSQNTCTFFTGLYHIRQLKKIMTKPKFKFFLLCFKIEICQILLIAKFVKISGQ